MRKGQKDRRDRDLKSARNNQHRTIYKEKIQRTNMKLKTHTHPTQKHRRRNTEASPRQPFHHSSKL